MLHRLACAGAFWALAGVAVCSTAMAEDTACHLKRIAYLDITPNSAGQPSVPITINGVSKPFFVDTAGYLSTVQQSTIDEMHLKTAHNKNKVFYPAYGKYSDQTAFPDSFQIGAIPVSKIGLVVIPEGIHLDPNDAGSIAGDILHLFDAEFDFAAAKFSLFLPNDCGDRVVHWTRAPYAILPFSDSAPIAGSVSYIITPRSSWHVIVPGKLDGMDVDVTIDTGSTTSFMTLEDAKSLLPPAQRQKLSGSNTSNTLFKKLELGGVTVNNPLIHTQPDLLSTEQHLGTMRPKLILGMSALQQLHLYFNYRDKKIYLTPASAH